MTVYQPLQKLGGTHAGRWDYTYSNSAGTFATGYCHEYIEPVDQGLVRWPEDERNAVIQNKHKYHSDGHETAAKAIACYNQYLADQRTRLYKKNQSEALTLERCLLCSEFTANAAIVNLHHKVFPLCDEHLTLQCVLDLMNLGK